MLQQTSYGKPYYIYEDHQVPFNISHHGDWVVVVGCKDGEIGVDILEIEYHERTYYDAFKDCFTEFEWSCINIDKKGVEYRFALFWCLKEGILIFVFG